jgi:hypothetical protein
MGFGHLPRVHNSRGLGQACLKPAEALTGEMSLVGSTCVSANETPDVRWTLLLGTARQASCRLVADDSQMMDCSPSVDASSNPRSRRRGAIVRGAVK